MRTGTSLKVTLEGTSEIRHLYHERDAMSEARVRPLFESDSTVLAQIHSAAFPGYFLSMLGTPFLRQFYRGFARANGAVSLVAELDGQVVGVVVGSLDPATFYLRLVKSRFIGFSGAAILASTRHPRLLFRIVRGAVYRGTPSGAARGAQLSSICVDPRFAGNRVGTVLIEHWCAAVAAHGIFVAHLTTDTEENDRANQFYLSRGWDARDLVVTRGGRRMNVYSKCLQSLGPPDAL